MNDRPLGIFDSGMGGITVLKEILKILPNESVIYLGDTARVPYGTRSDATIRKFADELVTFMLKKRVKAIVVACNTMSAIALNEIKKRAYDIPVVDVIGPTVRYAFDHRLNKIAAIGTRATIKSAAYQKQIFKLDRKAKVFEKACPLFVPLVEEGFTKGKAVEIIARDYLNELNLDEIDGLILGCTHYPILEPVIRNLLRRRIEIISSGLPTALELKSLLEKQDLIRNSKEKPYLKLLVTDSTIRAEEIAKSFFDNNFSYKFERTTL